MPELNNQNFNHLKIHTQYSICEGAIKIDNLKDFCKEKKIPCLGLSDTSNLCGALEFAENISKVGTQPIIGTQIYFKFEVEIINNFKEIWLLQQVSIQTATFAFALVSDTIRIAPFSCLAAISIQLTDELLPIH